MKFGGDTFSSQQDLIEFEQRNILVSQALAPQARSSWTWAKGSPAEGKYERGTIEEYLPLTIELQTCDDSRKQISFKSFSWLILHSLHTTYIFTYCTGMGHSHSWYCHPTAQQIPAPEGAVLFQVSEHLSHLSWERKSEKFSQNKLMMAKSGTETGEGGELGSWRTLRASLPAGGERNRLLHRPPSRSVSGDCSITGGPACVLPLPGRFKNSMCSPGRGGQGKNEDKRPFAGKLQAMNPAQA